MKRIQVEVLRIREILGNHGVTLTVKVIDAADKVVVDTAPQEIIGSGLLRLDFPPPIDLQEQRTVEQELREAMERMGVPDARAYTAGDLVELSNIVVGRSVASKVRALEGAAKACDRLARGPILTKTPVSENAGAEKCAAAIRALMEPKA